MQESWLLSEETQKKISAKQAKYIFPLNNGLTDLTVSPDYWIWELLEFNLQLLVQYFDYWNP